MHAPTAAAPPPLDHATVLTIITGIMLAMFLAALDQTIVATALPTIGHELGDLGNLGWVVSAYLLSSTAVTPLYGKLSDIHGRRPVLMTAIAIFIVGSVACAIAPTMLALIIARFVQGLGGGGLISLAQTVIADVVAPKERARYQAYIGGVFGASSVAGPVLGGFIAGALHWSVIFWINVPLGIAAFLMTANALKKLPRHERPHRLDLPGAVLMVAAALALLLALTWGGVRFAWSSVEILGLFGLSAVLWAGFVARVTTAPEPFVPLDVLFDRVVAPGAGAAFFAVGTMVGLSIYMPLYFEAIEGFSAAQSGAALVLFTATTVGGAFTAGRIMVRVRHYKRLPLVGLVVSAAGMIVLAWLSGRVPFWLLEILLAVAGFGLGTIFPISTVAVQNAVLPHQMGTATGLMNLLRSLGSALLVAGFGAVFLSVLAAGGGGTGSAEQLVAGAVAHGDGAAIAEAFRWVFVAAAISVAIAFVLILVMEERPLRGGAHPPPTAEG
ncbi:MDR family MFS transporter [Prosthecomicrobium pneumaticum]|uniref:EmrB/QacA subfamily drug resistance transporter n=1 Tax=Prosthecomicrobium pneumaticum TaxID=81895 RepID=A0A7W9CV40_9HYPH|nr:MDR family MFS transporter [Prosthecomicrobium pneumaticum]MBB5752146.1 EmrB/QacA subfamily drug resistance transporter [Prosthecomicrobium pneumaticum]